jgi:hypothetical protein
MAAPVFIDSMQRADDAASTAGLRSPLWGRSFYPWLRSRQRHERPLRRRKFAVIPAGKQVAVPIRRHLNRRMTQTALNQLDRQFQAPVSPAVDAPRGVEMAQRMQP